MKSSRPRKNFVPKKAPRRLQDESKGANELRAVSHDALRPRPTSFTTEALEKISQTSRPEPGSKPKNWETFVQEVKELLEPTASEKGYNATGVDGNNELFEFVQGIAGPGHALGEIVYKIVRYKNKKDEKDLLKIAAWAYLIWRFGK